MSIAFGVVLFARLNIGAVSLALLSGLFRLIYGFPRSRRASSYAGPGRGWTRPWFVKYLSLVVT